MDIRYGHYLSCLLKARYWCVSFEKLDCGLVQTGDDSTCGRDGVGAILIKMFDGMVRELKNVRYVPQMKKNLISIRALKAQGLEFSDRDGVLKILKYSMVMLKGVRRKTSVTRRVILLQGN